MFYQGINLVTELELLNNDLHIGTKPSEICFECNRSFAIILRQTLQCKWRDIIERVSSSLFERLYLIFWGYFEFLKVLVALEHILFAILKQHIQAAYDDHGKNNIAIFAAHVYIA